MRRGAFPVLSGPWHQFGHTRVMRQWALVFALLLGLAGEGCVSTFRPKLPIPIERRLDSFSHDGRTGRTLDWWRA
jgi:hypothetical protein